MKKRFGGLLAIALGTVLIVNGLSSAADGNVGVATGTPCGSISFGSLTPAGNCPAGAITITDTSGTGAGVPSSWDVTITSSCIRPGTTAPTNVVVTVPTGGSVESPDLYIFPGYGATSTSAKCSYALTRNVNPAYTATFTPASPVSLPFSDADSTQSQRVLQVTLLNQAVTVPTSTSAAPSSTRPSSPAASSSSASARPTGEKGSGSVAAASGSLEAAPIAETGPSQPVKASLWLGIGLVLLGLFLCFEGRVRRLARHRG